MSKGSKRRKEDKNRGNYERNYDQIFEESGEKMSKLNDFKKELSTLCTKYDASISVGFADCSDTHGMYDECINIEVVEVLKEGKTRRLRSYGKLTDGWFYP